MPRPRANDGGDAAHIAKLYRGIYAVIRKIPRGHVATYGQVAELAGLPRAARVVGTALSASTPAMGLPWQRVIGKKSRGRGKISIHDPIGAAMQRSMLEAEGVSFLGVDSGTIDLDRFGWAAAAETRASRRPPRRAAGARRRRRRG
jgi:methylated-DNA-protein-cysteine methyltransferase-like protein